jgi:competence protein ComEA
MTINRLFVVLLTCLAFQSPLSLAMEDAVPVPAQTVNINSADAQTLAQMLNGVGDKKAQAIITYRETYGPFESVDELAEVKGIGKALIQSNRGLIKLN